MFKENADEKTSRSLLDTIDELRTTPNKSSEIEPIRIFELNGNVYTLDHRRLVAHRLADSPIRFRKATEAETRKELRRKFTTKDGGMTIQIR